MSFLSDQSSIKIDKNSEDVFNRVLLQDRLYIERKEIKHIIGNSIDNYLKTSEINKLEDIIYISIISDEMRSYIVFYDEYREKIYEEKASVF